MRTFDLFVRTLKGLLENPDTGYEDIYQVWRQWGDDEAWLFGLTPFEYGVYMDIANLIFAYFGMPTVEVG